MINLKSVLKILLCCCPSNFSFQYSLLLIFYQLKFSPSFDLSRSLHPIIRSPRPSGAYYIGARYPNMPHFTSARADFIFSTFELDFPDDEPFCFALEMVKVLLIWCQKHFQSSMLISAVQIGIIQRRRLLCGTEMAVILKKGGVLLVGSTLEVAI